MIVSVDPYYCVPCAADRGGAGDAVSAADADGKTTQSATQPRGTVCYVWYGFDPNQKSCVLRYDTATCLLLKVWTGSFVVVSYLLTGVMQQCTWNDQAPYQSLTIRFDTIGSLLLKV